MWEGRPIEGENEWSLFTSESCKNSVIVDSSTPLSYDQQLTSISQDPDSDQDKQVFNYYDCAQNAEEMLVPPVPDDLVA
uniref:NAC domain-containing protein n=1 Tax=Syphacia muris TaxID=451379 RepID=A0A0N5A8X9_9BILA